MPYADCVDCGAEFYRDEGMEWKTRCISCFKRSKRRAEQEIESGFDRMAARDRPSHGSGELQSMEIRALEMRITALRAAVLHRDIELDTIKGRLREAQADLVRERSLRREPPPPPQPTLQDLPVTVKELIKLTHPDRHGGSELANRVTGALLTVMRRLRA